MKRRILPLLLILALLLTPAALAKDLPVVRTDYRGYADVKATDYFAEPARLCFRTVLITGYEDGSFRPNDPMPIYQVAVLAARIRAAFLEETAPGVAGTPWYQPSVDYLTQSGVDLPGDLTVNATRLQFFQILSAVVPPEELGAINAIRVLPDTDDPAVLTFYNAGILTGIDEYGTFYPNGTIPRKDCATMIARILQPSLRQRFSPAGSDPDQVNGDTVVLTVNNFPIRLDTFINALGRAIYYTDYSLYRATGSRLDWSARYDDVDDLETWFLDQAVTACAQQAMAQLQASSLGCSVDRLMDVTVAAPTRAALADYVSKEDYLAAKHILVDSYETAQVILNALDQIPTMDQFNALMTVYNTDPGMSTYPEGYLFQEGEMVAEFEAGTRSLAINTYSREPVATAYGYHIIWRLDPAAVVQASNSPQYDTLAQNYRTAAYTDLLNRWLKSAVVTVNTPVLQQLDVPACYQAYLQALYAAGNG